MTSSSEDQPNENPVEALLALYNQGRLAEVIERTNALVEKFPDEIVLFNILGAANAGLKRFDDAIESYNRAILIDPSVAALHNNLGNAQQDKGDLAAAIASFGKALELDPDYAEAHSGLGGALKDSGDIPAAIDSYNRALAINPDFAEALNNLGNAYREQGDFPAAVERYKRALAIRGDYAEAHYNLGRAQHEMGDVPAAIESYRSAVAINKDFVEAHNSLGGALRVVGDLDSAIESYTSAIYLNPDYAGYHFNLGAALKDKGDLDDAIECYAHALQLRPDFAEAHRNLGHALKEKGDYAAAIGRYITSLEIKPDDVEARDNLGGAYFDSGCYEEALESYDRADTPKARADSLACLYALGRYDEFERRVQDNLDLDKTNLRVASVCSFASDQIGRDIFHPFCKDPLDFINFGHVRDHTDDADDFIDALDAELSQAPAVWEPVMHTTVHGFHTHGNLFETSSDNIVRLEGVIKQEMSAYFEKFKADPCLLMQMWPRDLNITGWSVRLRQYGFQSSHIHPAGWLSGVVYVKLVESANKDEGAIVFELRPYDYPLVKEDYAKVTVHPKRGDIVLFPSSLFHYTVPIKGDGERMIVAFDLLPG
ncbi:MAG: tetratricopeptide repeat protein [Rhodospirillaceae bacterium]|jgi:uncharacterized protein (TIGR02466 family)|nr:tetratricopeptide repeat protein [Rhodospirillaceae bacterium]MBT5810458.1 tetratricopeptide repeat protein [Rhodospirillaceae bacterium]